MTIDNSDTGGPDDYELLATGVWKDGEVVSAVVRVQRQAPLPPMPPLPEPSGRCARRPECLDGECYCGEPMLDDFAFPNGDGPDSYGSWGSWEE
ncbi:hypothetical protein [Kitasatospora sp. NPDC059327]|uniref:hypothetical protein n=1 Tax=Kitasatospora sp. NPDC059327 TaxID=3346803 RepID=UPI0036B567FD